MKESEAYFEKGVEFAHEANMRYDMLQCEQDNNRRILLSESFKVSLNNADFCFRQHSTEEELAHTKPSVDLGLGKAVVSKELAV